jgi:hypothetical protein
MGATKLDPRSQSVGGCRPTRESSFAGQLVPVDLQSDGGAAARKRCSTVCLQNAYLTLDAVASGPTYRTENNNALFVRNANLKAL